MKLTIVPLRNELSTAVRSVRAVIASLADRDAGLYVFSVALVAAGAAHVASGPDYVESQAFTWTALLELYAWALVIGAAVLRRRHRYNAARLLAGLVVLIELLVLSRLHSSDLLEELDFAYAWVWLVLCGCKLGALYRALGPARPRWAWWAPLAVAPAVVFLPYWASVVHRSSVDGLVSLWLFSIAATVLWGRRWSEPGQLETKRKTQWQAVGSWGLAAGCAAWLLDLRRVLDPEGHYTDSMPYWCAAVLLLTRATRREWVVWSMALIALGLGVVSPFNKPAIAAMMAATLLLHAYRRPMTQAANDQLGDDPYRSPPGTAPLGRAFGIASDAARHRFVVGAASSTYLLWTSLLSRTSCMCRIHSNNWIVTDAAFLLLSLAMVWKFRSRLALVPLGLVAATLSHESGIAEPLSQTGLGMVLLGAGLGVIVVALTWPRCRSAVRKDGLSTSTRAPQVPSES